MSLKSTRQYAKAFFIERFSLEYQTNSNSHLFWFCITMRCVSIKAGHWVLVWTSIGKFFLQRKSLQKVLPACENLLPSQAETPAMLEDWPKTHVNYIIIFSEVNPKLMVTPTHFLELHQLHVFPLSVDRFTVIICALCDWPEWFLQFGFCNSQLKTDQKNSCKFSSVHDKTQCKLQPVGLTSHTNVSGCNTGSGDV